MALTKVTYSMIQGEAFNVLDYGALGNGIADDSIAINAAATALAAAGGGTLYFPPGSYLLKSQQIAIKSNVKYQGAGIGATKILLGTTGTFYPSGFSNYPYAALPNVSNVIICDLTIDGQYNTTPDGGDDNYQIGIYCNRVTNAVFERLHIKNVWYAGFIMYDNNDGITVKDCMFDNVGDKPTIVGPTGNYYAIGVDFSDINFSVLNNVIRNCGRGINMFGDGGPVARGVIADNRIDTVNDYAIYGRQGCKDLIIANNVAYNMGNGFIQIYDDTGAHNGGNTNHISIENNIIDVANTNEASGFFVIDIACQRATSITNNIIINVNSNGAPGGIIVRGGASGYDLYNGQICNNVITGAFASYYAITVDANNFLVSNNIIDGQTTGKGILIDANCSYITVDNNKFFQCASQVVNTAPITNNIKINNTPSTNRVTVATSATTIASLFSNNASAFFQVCGIDGSGNIFNDFVMTVYGKVSVVSSNNSFGSPAARTYSQSGTLFLLAMASGSYTVDVTQVMNSF